MASALPPELRIFGAPGRYLQGPGAIDRLGAIVERVGGDPVVIIDEAIMALLGERLQRSLSSAPMVGFAGEVTAAAIQDLSSRAGGLAAGVIVAVGGGKALDIGKGVALSLGLPVVTVPTIASNDSPTSKAIAIYDDEHLLVSVEQMPSNPAYVVVDTAVIAQAPPRFLTAGIGDALAKKFEAEGCSAGGGITMHQTRPLLAAGILAGGCYETLREHAEPAMAAARAHRVDRHLEATVEAVVLLAGLGFENGGLSIAHSATRGLMVARGARTALHGHHVAYGLLVQWQLEGRDDAFFAEHARFYRAVGLPLSLEELGMDAPSVSELREIAQRTVSAPHSANLAHPVDADGVLAAIAAVEARAPAPGWR